MQAAHHTMKVNGDQLSS